MVFIPRRLGGGPRPTSRNLSQGFGSAGNTGNPSGGKGTIFGARKGVSNSVLKANPNRYQAGSGVDTNSTGLGATTSTTPRPKWGFYEALVGKRGEKKIGSSSSEKNIQKSKGLKVRFVKGEKYFKKDMEVRYNPRKSKQRMEIVLPEGGNKLATAHFRRKVSEEISKQMVELSRGNSKFREQQGFKYISESERHSLAKKARHSSSVKRALRRAGNSDFGGTKSSRRNIVIDI